jgi:hypothetical protein
VNFRLFEKAAMPLVLSASICTLGFTGCSSNAPSTLAPTTVTGSSAKPTTLNENWQIQTGSSISSPQGARPFVLTGAMQIQGSQVSGIFQTNAGCVYPGPYTYTGSYNATTGSLSLTSGYVSAQLAMSTDPTNLSSGTIGGGGQICNAITGQGPAVGIEIPSLTGTFTGAVTSATTGNTGNVTLTVAQAPTATTDGQFALTGTLQFASTTCNNTVDITGSISGHHIVRLGQCWRSNSSLHDHLLRKRSL